MPLISMSYVKNIMNRRISEVLDPSPTENEKNYLRAFFQNECAFCGEKLGKQKGDIHFDHLVAASMGGKNGLSNRGIACNRCNVEEKRDAAWEAFLQTKCLDEQTFAARRQLITDWLRRPEASDSSPPSEELAEAIKRAQNTIIQFEHDCQRIKDAVQRQGST